MTMHAVCNSQGVGVRSRALPFADPGCLSIVNHDIMVLISACFPLLLKSLVVCLLPCVNGRLPELASIGKTEGDTAIERV